MPCSSDGDGVVREIKRRARTSWWMFGTAVIAVCGALATCQSFRWVSGKPATVRVDAIYFALLVFAGVLAAWFSLSTKRLLGRVFREVRRLVAAREALVAVVLHDLKAPVNAISANAQLVRSGDRDADHALGKIIEECERIRDGIARNIEITDNYTGNAKGEPVPVDMSAFVADIVADAKDVAEAKGVSLRCCVEREGIEVEAVPSKMESLVANLVDNAVKYTDAGGRVTVSLRQDGPDAVLRVFDTGIGISAADMEHVYERRFRSEEARRCAEGSGLGLAQVKSIVALYDGDIECESAPGRGTVFTVTLPRLERRLPPAAPASTKTSS